MRRGDLFVLSWESLRRVEWGKVSSFLSMSGGGLFNKLLNNTLVYVIITPITTHAKKNSPHQW